MEEGLKCEMVHSCRGGVESLMFMSNYDIAQETLFAMQLCKVFFYCYLTSN